MKLTAESTVVNDAKINTDIDGAQTTADNAQTSADNAQSTADTAVSKADNAQATANQAKQVADNTAQYFWFKSTGSDTGAHISEKTQAQFEANPSGGNLLARSNGIAVRDGLSELATFGTTTRVGLQSSRHIEIKDGGVQVYQDANRIIGHFGYGLGTDENGTETVAPYFSLGIRPDNSTVGNYSVAEGYESIASGYVSHAEGFRTTTTVDGYGAHTEGYNTTAGARGAHAEGGYTTASGQCAHAEGGSTTASGDRSFAGGIGTIANGNEQMAIGRYNVADTTSLFIIGNGYDGGRSNAFVVGASGDVTIPDNANYQGGHTRTSFTPLRGANYAGYGGCYYEKFGSVVHVHVGVSGLTANTATNIQTLPSGFRPPSLVFAHGTGGSWNNLGYLQVDSSGTVMVRSEGTYCGADVTFMV